MQNKAMYQQKFPHGITFHRFKKSKDKNTINGTLTAKNLTDLINFIGRERILNPNEWIDNLNKCNLAKKDVCLTFDDGLKSQIKIALPILDKFKIKAFWGNKGKAEGSSAIQEVWSTHAGSG